MIIEMESKTCPNCNTTYEGESKESLAKFFGWRRKGYTLSSYCKVCRKEMNRQRYKEKREEILEKNAEYYQNNKEKIKKYYIFGREERIERQTKWNQENAEKRISYNQTYYYSNRDKLLATAKQKKSVN